MCLSVASCIYRVFGDVLATVQERVLHVIGSRERLMKCRLSSYALD